MLKPSKSASTKPIHNSGSFVKGFYGFFDDTTVSEVAATEALEAASLMPGAMSYTTSLGNTPDKQPDTSTILKKDGAYYVYFHSSELWASWWGTNLASFTKWAMSLTAEDTIYFYQTGRVLYFPFIVQILTVLDVHCKAKKIFVVDHIIETPLFLFVGDEIRVEDTGAIIFSDCIDIDRSSKAERTLIPYLRQLYERAITRRLLSAEEVRSILDDNQIVFKTARQLRVQMTPPTI